MADVTLIPRVANFSYRLQYNVAAATSALTTTMLATDEQDLITVIGSVTATTITLPPINQMVKAKKIDASAVSGSVFTISPGINPDTYASDTINGTTSYSLTSGRAVVVESEIGHNWKVFLV